MSERLIAKNLDLGFNTKDYQDNNAQKIPNYPCYYPRNNCN